LEAKTAYQLPEDEVKMLAVHRQIKDHGFGEYSVNFSEIRFEYKTRIYIRAGKSWIFFIDKPIPGADKKGII